MNREQGHCSWSSVLLGWEDVLLTIVSLLPGGVTVLSRKGCTQGRPCRDDFAYHPLCLCYSLSPPAQCGHTSTHDRSKEEWAVVLLRLTKGASDPERCHHLSEASSGLAGLTQYLRKTCTFPNQQREAMSDVLGHPKWIKPLIHQRMYSFSAAHHMLCLLHCCMLSSLSCWPSCWGKCRHAVMPSLETMEEFTSCI